MKDLLFDKQRSDALLVGCEYCGQPAGELCVNPRTDDYVENQAAHFVRITAGGKASAR